VGNQQLSIHITRLLDYLKSSGFLARESCSRAVIPLPKNLSRKIARFFVSKIGPATGVTLSLELFYPPVTLSSTLPLAGEAPTGSKPGLSNRLEKR